MSFDITPRAGAVTSLGIVGSAGGDDTDSASLSLGLLTGTVSSDAATDLAARGGATGAAGDLSLDAMAFASAFGAGTIVETN